MIKLQTANEKRRGVYYQIDPDSLPIGEGGMGKVYKGLRIEERSGASREVAIKFMFDDLPPSAYERARREASIQLRNDSLVEMLDFIEIPETTIGGDTIVHYHVVSELLNGVSLSDIMDGKTKGRDGEDIPFAVKMQQQFNNAPENFAVTIIKNVLSGLMALHDAGYIHRDIDPSNIMLTDDNHIKLIDFGIAKHMNELRTVDKQLTVAGKFMGKPEYAAPELALGDVKHQNQTTDIYAMGILLYQCIVGHTPFTGAMHDVLQMQISQKNNLPLDKIKDKELRKIIAKACDKKQDKRYQTSSQMRVALEEYSLKPKTKGTSISKGLLAGIAASVVVIISICCVLFIKGGSELPVNEPNAEVSTVLIREPAQIAAIAADTVAGKTDDVQPESQTVSGKNPSVENKPQQQSTPKKEKVDVKKEEKKEPEKKDSKQEDNGSLSASPMTVSFKAKPKGDETVYISGNGKWIVVSSPLWITTRKDGSMLHVSATNNETGDKRRGTIIIKNGNNTCTINVEQKRILLDKLLTN